MVLGMRWRGKSESTRWQARGHRAWLGPGRCKRSRRGSPRSRLSGCERGHRRVCSCRGSTLGGGATSSTRTSGAGNDSDAWKERWGEEREVLFVRWLVAKRVTR